MIIAWNYRAFPKSSSIDTWNTLQRNEPRAQLWSHLKSMPPEIIAKPPEVTNLKLHLFSLYLDFPASAHARWLTAAIENLVGPRRNISGEMWKIDFLMASENIRKMVNDEAANADVIIIAASSLVKPEMKLIQWLQELSNGKGNGTKPGLLIGLLGDENTKTLEIDWVVKAMIQSAQVTGRSFIWHWMGELPTNDLDWLTENLEALLDPKTDPAYFSSSP